MTPPDNLEYISDTMYEQAGAELGQAQLNLWLDFDFL